MIPVPGVKWLERTYELLDHSNLKHREIAAGAGVDINWLAKFKRRVIGDPGITKVQGVHDYLSNLRASLSPDASSARSKRARKIV